MQQFDLKVYNLIVLQIETKKSNTADKCGDSTKYFQSNYLDLVIQLTECIFGRFAILLRYTV